MRRFGVRYLACPRNICMKCLACQQSAGRGNARCRLQRTVLDEGSLVKDLINLLYIHHRRRGVLVTGRIGYLLPYTICVERRAYGNHGSGLSVQHELIFRQD